ncbi:MAG: SusC/RagA family TonB-linked outer membrane protein [Gemmatimonadaceae bacterium]
MSLSQFFRSVAVTLGLALVPAAAQAQNATLTGRVIDQATGQPLSDVRVIVAGTPRGSRTGEDGRFQIVGVPTGAIEIRAIRIGYQGQTQTVTIVAGTTQTLDFALHQTATTLDQVTVTATGETQRRRESGVSTAKIDTAQINMASVQNFSDVLSSRAPGVVVQQAGGTTGGSSRIRVRGSNSINLANDPLLIVDGIRANNNPNSTAIGVGGQTPSRFNDINSEDIESVEIIKGPAAAALYGTAASNGVIQVTTKRGKAGRPRWQANAEYGTVRQQGDYQHNYRQIGTNPNGSRNTDCNLDNQVRGVCTAKPDSLLNILPLALASPFRDGWREQYGTNVSGGSDVTQYYMGSDFEREEGVYAVNWLQKANVRANVNAQVRPNVQLSINGGYTGSRLRLPQNDNDVLGAISGSLIGKAFDCHTVGQTNAGLPPNDATCGTDSLSRGYRNPNYPATRIYAYDTRQNVERLIGGAQANWQPASWLSVIGTGGMDLLERYDQETLPQGAVTLFNPEGYRQVNRAEIRTYTTNTSATGTFGLTESLRSITTLGAQWNREAFSRTDAFGDALLPGTSSLNGTSSLFSVGESNSDIITLGYIATERLEWRDKLFLSVGLREDKNSNFGVNLPFVRYPSAQLSWVVGEEPWFPKTNIVNALRLRFAYGESGQRPDFRQADKFFNPVAVNVQGNEVSGITLGGAGNANLKPERTREVEFGFDASFLSDRVNLEFTKYAKATRDALIGRVLAPSLGATNTQLVNLGRVDNRGHEVLLDLKPLTADRFKFDVSFNGSVNDNKVVNLGCTVVAGVCTPITPIIFGLGGASQRHQNGYPLGGYWDWKLVSFEDKNGDGIISRVNCPTYNATPNPQIAGGPACEVVLSDTAVYLGNPLGRTELAVTPNLTLLNWLNIRALFDHRGGLTLNNSTEFFRCSSSSSICKAIEDKSASLLEQAKAISTRMGSRGAYFENANFWKLRELAITATLPQTFANSVRASNVSVTLSGRNLKTWTKYTGLDPELNTSSASNFNTADFLTQPPTRYWVARLNMTF